MHMIYKCPDRNRSIYKILTNTQNEGSDDLDGILSLVTGNRICTTESESKMHLLAKLWEYAALQIELGPLKKPFHMVFI